MSLIQLKRLIKDTEYSIDSITSKAKDKAINPIQKNVYNHQIQSRREILKKLQDQVDKLSKLNLDM